ncbi:flagellar motor switch protein FliM [Sphingomonas montana]|uniref:flagellar motor switch protein FliM n=1 Tax=Sphingomonas montana TaxID=1843236 RepID=UPI0009F975BC|nr:FliM/FliN family flagellar motor switch protein [Sphingomonas montana]
MTDAPPSPFSAGLGARAQPGAKPATKDVQPFVLGGEAFHPTARLAGLERIAERLTQPLRAIVEPFSRTRTEVIAQPIETVRFDVWKDRMPGFQSISLFRLRPMKAGLLIAVEPGFVARLVDTFYGGAGKAGRAVAREFTPTEDQMLTRITDELVEKLVAIWADVVTVSPSLGGRETKIDHVSLVRGDEPVVVQRFVVTPMGQPASTVSLVWSLAAIRPFEAQLAAKVHDDAGPADADWRARMAHALENVRLPVRSVLARPELSVSQLMQLKVGDVIPITLAQKAPLIVASRKFAHGTIGERDGRAALMIEQVGGGDE